jgi:glycosyltransferase involved in cell wall biosynthesis
MSKVLVWMPAYNEAKHIGAAIDSILAQTFTDFTLLISDNFCTDGTVDEIVKRQDTRIKLMTPPMHLAGIPHMNFCWQRLDTGEHAYSIMIGAHDQWDKSCLERLVARMEAPPLHGERPRAIVYPETYQMNEAGTICGLYLNYDQWSHPSMPTLPVRIITSVDSPQVFGLWNEEIRRQVPMRHECSGWDHLIVMHACMLGQVLYEPNAKFIMRAPPADSSLEKYGQKHLSKEILAAGTRDFFNQLEWCRHVVNMASEHIGDVNGQVMAAVNFNAIASAYMVLRGYNLMTVPGAYELFAGNPEVSQWFGLSMQLANMLSGMIDKSQSEVLQLPQEAPPAV